MKPEIPEHIAAQIDPLRAEGKSIEEIAFLLRLDSSVIQQWLNTTSANSLAHPSSKRKRGSND